MKFIHRIGGPCCPVPQKKKKEQKPDPANGHAYVEIGGLKWATMNIGATSETDYGLYFQWGDTQGYTASQVGSGEGQKAFAWADYKWSYNGGRSWSETGEMTKYNNNDQLTRLSFEDDAARVNWGGSWRMPTTEELQALENAANAVWTTNYNGSGVNGILYTDKTDSSKTLFFPAGGFAGDESMWDINYKGSVYSSSTKYDDTTGDVTMACYLEFASDYIHYDVHSYRYSGSTVRGVLDVSEE